MAPGRSRKAWSTSARTSSPPRGANFSRKRGAVPGHIAEDLGAFRQPGGKVIRAFAVEGNFDPADLKSNLFAMEWPPKSGKLVEFPEADRAGWFAADEARRKALRGQIPIIDKLFSCLAS
jgi:predicted NUDIX family NTP pyrophosphohydrolase